MDALLNPGAGGNFGGAGVGGSAGGGNGSGNVTVLSDARANADNYAVAATAQQNAAQAAQPATPPALPEAAAANAADLEHEENTQVQMDDQAKARAQQLQNATGTYYSRGILQGPQGLAQLQTAGAISLPLDFPTDGLRVYHFKKLNTNARLTFWITNGEGLDKWKWFAVFAVVALLALGVFKFIDRGYLRVLRRRVVHI